MLSLLPTRLQTLCSAHPQYSTHCSWLLQRIPASQRALRIHRRSTERIKVITSSGHVYNHIPGLIRLGIVLQQVEGESTLFERGTNWIWAFRKQIQLLSLHTSQLTTTGDLLVSLHEREEPVFDHSPNKMNSCYSNLWCIITHEFNLKLNGTNFFEFFLLYQISQRISGPVIQNLEFKKAAFVAKW